jgi:hypothetical protein
MFILAFGSGQGWWRVTAHTTKLPEISPARGPPQWDEADLKQDIYEYQLDQTGSCKNADPCGLLHSSIGTV